MKHFHAMMRTQLVHYVQRQLAFGRCRASPACQLLAQARLLSPGGPLFTCGPAQPGRFYGEEPRPRPLPLPLPLFGSYLASFASFFRAST